MTVNGLYFPAKKMKKGYNLLVSPKNSVLDEIRTGRLLLVQKSPFLLNTGDTETTLLVLRGKIRITTKGSTAVILKRRSPFLGPPVLVVLPTRKRHILLSTSSTSDLLVFQVRVANSIISEPLIIDSKLVQTRTVGKRNWKREVWPGTAESGLVRRLLVGETDNPPGNWSSFPPHKHDAHKPPREEKYEEVYFYLFDPPQGFAFQGIYDKQKTELAHIVRNGGTVVIPHGYHPVTVAPGYRLKYAWALCGKRKLYEVWTEDPNHSWVDKS